MNFISTKNQYEKTNLFNALTTGSPADGGLFMPENIPELSQGFLISLSSLSLNEIALEVLKPYLSEIKETELNNILIEAFNFPAPVKQLADNLFVLELWHGPTLAFKDFGARFLATLLEYLLQKVGEGLKPSPTRANDNHLTILTSTSGDTGSAVAHAFHNKK